MFVDWQGRYKLGDFGSYFEKKELSWAKSQVGTLAFMSPQQREVHLGETQSYNPFKADVFGLAVTVFALASLHSPFGPCPLSQCDHMAKTAMDSLSYSLSLKDLLLAMLAATEEARPTMKAVLELVTLQLKEKNVSRKKILTSEVHPETPRVPPPPRKRPNHRVRPLSGDNPFKASAEDELLLGLAAKAAGNHETALRHMQQAYSLQPIATSHLCLPLGSLLAYFARFSEAESILRQGLLAVPLRSEASLLLSNGLIEVLAQAGRWEETVTVCEKTMDESRGTGYQYEQLRTLYYLIKAHVWLKDKRVTPIIEERRKLLEVDSSACISLVKFIRAEKEKEEMHFQAAEREYEEARIESLPLDYTTVCASVDLGVVSHTLQRFELAETQLVQANKLLTQHFPCSLETAHSFYRLGDFYKLRRPDLAEQHYLKASEQSEAFPRLAGFVLSSLGHLYKDKKELKKAEKRYVRACELLSIHQPNALEFATCVASLAGLYQDLGQVAEAEARYKQALDLYAASRPHSLEQAKCEYHLGLLCGTTGRKAEAVQRLETARRLYAAHNFQVGVQMCESCAVSLTR